MPRIPQLLPCQGYANSKPLHESQHFQGLRQVWVAVVRDTGATEVGCGHNAEGTSGTQDSDAMPKPNDTHWCIGVLIGPVHDRIVQNLLQGDAVSISLIRTFTHRRRAGSLSCRTRHRPLGTAWQTNMKGEVLARIREPGRRSRTLTAGSGTETAAADMQAIEAHRVVQPPYAPEQNPVEYFRRAIEGRVHPTLQAWLANPTRCGNCAAGVGFRRPDRPVRQYSSNPIVMDWSNWQRPQTFVLPTTHVPNPREWLPPTGTCVPVRCSGEPYCASAPRTDSRKNRWTPSTIRSA